MSQVTDLAHTSLWSQGWMIAQMLRLDPPFTVVWPNFIKAICSSHISFTDRWDELVWVHAPHSKYTPKQVYI